jgi:hypothetical protein
MLNSEKTELKRIILEDIPSHITSEHNLAKIHRRYAPEYSYGTFRKYWKTFRGGSDSSTG